MDYPYPIKKWQNESQYKNITSFAWEFLRRNEAYQQEYDLAVAVNHEGTKIVNPYLLNDLCSKYRILPARSVMIDFDDSLDLDENIDLRMFPIATNPPIYFDDCFSDSLVIDCGQLFQYDFKFWGQDQSMREHLGMGVLKANSMEEIIVKFNIGNIVNLNSQIEEAHKNLKRFARFIDAKERRANKVDKAKIIPYLRILDAYASDPKIKPSIIAKVLLPNEENNAGTEFLPSKTIARWRKQALKITKKSHFYFDQ